MNSDLLSCLAAMPDAVLDPTELLGIRARLGRLRMFEDRRTEAETVLRGVLHQSGAVCWEDEFVARRFLATVLVTEGTNPDVATLTEAEELLEPFTTKRNPASRAHALHLLARVVNVHGRLNRLTDDNVAATKRFRRGAESPRMAVEEARDVGDTESAEAERWFGLNSIDPRARFGMATVLFERGDLDGARAAITTLRDAAPPATIAKLADRLVKAIELIDFD